MLKSGERERERKNERIIGIVLVNSKMVDLGLVSLVTAVLVAQVNIIHCR